MNYRRALRTSTDAGLVIFLIMVAGVLLWTTDEMLNWNILPDWIDKYAQLIVIALSILAACSVVISVMCSFAVLAESAAEKAGIVTAAPSPRARRFIIIVAALAFLGMFGLHKVDQYRASQREKAEKQRERARYLEVQKELESRVPHIVSLFSPALAQHLVANGIDPGDEAVARLLNAIESSTPFGPEVSVMIRAATPYQYCVITALPEPRQASQDSRSRFLKRQFLTDVPTGQEREFIQSVFQGRRVSIPEEIHGIFIDSRKPSAWGTVIQEDKVLAVIMLRGTP